MTTFKSNSLKKAHQQGYDHIMAYGLNMKDDDVKIKESLNLNFFIDTYDLVIPPIDNDYYEWMYNNFNQVKRVPELNNCWSYAWRLYNYDNINQIQWVIDKLKKKPESKSATITTLQVAGKESYIPCVSLFDYKRRGGSLHTTVFCRSLDFKKKAQYNFYCIGDISQKIAKALRITHHTFKIYVASGHIYVEDIL